jgi:transketolase
MGIGMALSLSKHQIFVLMGDGEVNEGSVWEGFMFAGQKRL